MFTHSITLVIQLVGLEGARSIMEVVGMSHGMGVHTLLVWLAAIFIFYKLLNFLFILTCESKFMF